MHDPQSNLNLLLQRATAERDAALLALRRAESALDAATHRCDQLGQYRGEFQAQWAARFRRGGTATLALCRHDFGQRLDQAIDLQQAQVRQARSRLDTARALVIEREQRVASVRKLLERRAQAAQRVADRREQRATDEAAQRAHLVAAHH